MATAILVFLVLVIWTVCSVTFFLRNMGNKYRRSKWYDRVLLVPMGVIIFIFVKLNRGNSK